MITLNFKKEEKNFAQYSCEGYVITAEDCEFVKNARQYKFFINRALPGNSYLPQINYDNYDNNGVFHFYIYHKVQISSDITDADEVISELHKFENGLNEAKSVIAQLEECLASNSL